MGEKSPGQRIEVKIEDTPAFDRNSQTQMYSSVPLKTWGIFCPEKEKDTCTEFINTI